MQRKTRRGCKKKKKKNGRKKYIGIGKESFATRDWPDNSLTHAHTHRKISPRVVEIVLKNRNMAQVFAEMSNKSERGFTHSQDNTFYAVTLFLHRGYEHSYEISQPRKRY
ncbi:unnamed protein product [Lasius platythorax]|uniref:Uncharacterized protein n=1 Tax=Lasius platythorax TaxID=488582 RepID=A0AAV2NFH4_9HYME